MATSELGSVHPTDPDNRPFRFSDEQHDSAKGFSADLSTPEKVSIRSVQCPPESQVMAKRRPSATVKKSHPKLTSRNKKQASRRSAAKTKTPQFRLVREPDEKAQAEEIFASGLPSHGYARTQARNAVFGYGVSLTRVSMVVSKAMNTTISANKLAAALRKKGVPIIKIEYDDPLIYEIDDGYMELLKRPVSGLAGKVIDVFELVKLVPGLTGGASEDFYMPPNGVEVLEGLAAYSSLKRKRVWKRFKERQESQD
jgi:hypothetical protein